MEIAIKIAKTFTSHALAAFAITNIDPAVTSAVKVADRLKEGQRDTFSVNEAFTRFQRTFKRVDHLRNKPAAKLEQH
jgi:hypothetical protein